MPRRNEQRTGVADFRGGICQQEENARRGKNGSYAQLADARNVWAPDGRLVRRPGLLGLTSPIRSSYGIFGAAYAYDATGGTFLALDPNPKTITGAYDDAADYLYLAGTYAFDYYSFVFSGTQANATETKLYAEYWNGTAWTHLPAEYSVCVSVASDAPGTTSSGLTYNWDLEDQYYDWKSGFLLSENTVTATNVAELHWVAPADWASTSINSLNRFWIRFKYLNAALTASVQFSALPGAGFHTYNAAYPGQEYWKSGGANVTQYANGERQYQALIVGNQLFYDDWMTTQAPIYLSAFTAPLNSTGITYKFTPGQTTVAPNECVLVPFETAMFAPVVSFRETFLAHQHQVYRVGVGATAANPPAVAVVETNPIWVGTVGGIKSPYHPDYIDTLGSFPRAQYIIYSGQMLWVANLLDNPYQIRWSAPSLGAHKVWPNVSTDVLVENDSSPITGLAALHEQVVVFKQDSIWIMVFAGMDENKLPVYVPKKVVGGVGCVSNASIQEVGGMLIFLSEDGLYAFDGTPNIKKISDPLNDFFDAGLNKGLRQFSSAVNWKTKHCYLLAVASVGSATNDFIVVWDYQHNSWWLWDGFSIATLFKDEGTNDEEEIYATDPYTRIYQLDAGNGTDHGATISSYILTHRMLAGDPYTKTFRSVTVTTTNKAKGIRVDLLANDALSSSTTVNLDLVDPEESVVGTAVAGTDTVGHYRRLTARLDTRITGEWCQVKVSHATKYESWELKDIDVAFNIMGVR